MPVSSSQRIPTTWIASMPGDNTTYYPVGILKDTQSGAIIQQINLTQDLLFSQRYNAVFDGVSDPSGLGRFFDITIYVYTDAAHTTLSQNYEIHNQTYRTFDITLTGSPNGPSANAGIGTNYKRIEESFTKVLEARMLKAIEEMRSHIRSMPKTEVDYDRLESSMLYAAQSSMSEALEGLKPHFADISKMLLSHKDEILKRHDTYHNVVSGALGSLSDLVGSVGRNGRMSSSEMQEAIMEAIKSTSEEIKKHHNDDHEALGKRFDESNSIVHDSLKNMLTDKEIHLKLDMQHPSEKKGEKKEKVDSETAYDDGAMKALLNIK